MLTRACLESCIWGQYSQGVPSVGFTWVGSWEQVGEDVLVVLLSKFMLQKSDMGKEL